MKAVIFDLDGVLIDSEPLHALADIQLLKESGISVPSNYFERFVGLTNKAMWGEIKKDYDITLSVEELIDLQMPMKLEMFQKFDYQPVSGIVELLERIKKMGIPMAIASSSPREFIEAVIEKIEIKQYFTKWLSGEEVAHSKPEPDIFLKVSELLNVDPHECIVIEDSTSGIIAAKRAGMTCIGYKNINSGNQDLSAADFIVDKIEEIDFAGTTVAITNA
jgi:HAD superfamily hydrolase (TIGR01509 family)